MELCNGTARITLAYTCSFENAAVCLFLAVACFKDFFPFPGLSPSYKCSFYLIPKLCRKYLTINKLHWGEQIKKDIVTTKYIFLSAHYASSFYFVLFFGKLLAGFGFAAYKKCAVNMLQYTLKSYKSATGRQTDRQADKQTKSYVIYDKQVLPPAALLLFVSPFSTNTFAHNGW